MAKKKVEECPNCNEPFAAHESLAECFEVYTGMKPVGDYPQLIKMARTYLPVKKIKQSARLFTIEFENDIFPPVETYSPAYDVYKLIMQAKQMAEPREVEDEPDEPELIDGTE